MPVLDIDGNGAVTALSDGLLIVRYLQGQRGALLTVGAIGSGATRTTPSAIIGYIEDIYERLDADGNGEVALNSDGILILRYLFGITGDTLIDGVVEPGAGRSTAQQIADYLGTLVV